VRAVVIHDQMHVQLRWNSELNTAQKCQELLMPVTGLAVGQHRAVEHVQSGKECGGAVALVVVCDSFGVAQSQRRFRQSMTGMGLALWCRLVMVGAAGGHANKSMRRHPWQALRRPRRAPRPNQW